jgi:hypothetical protein
MVCLKDLIPVRLRMNGAQTGRRLCLPWDVVDLIVEETWRDLSIQSHASLYLALAQTCVHLRQRATKIAWRFVFVRSPQDFRLYLRLRYGNVVHPEDQLQSHTELNVAVVWLQPLSILRQRASPPAHVLEGWSSTSLRDIRPEIYARTDLYAFDAPEEFSVVAPAALVRIYPWRDTVVLQNALNWLHALPAPPPSGLALVLRHVSPLLQAPSVSLPSVAHVTLDLADEPHHAKQWDTWIGTRTSLQSLFPRLESVAIFGRFCDRPLAPYPLPSSTKSLLLEVKPGRDIPSIYDTGLTNALKSEFDLDDAGKPSVRMTLLTATGELEGWLEASRMAKEKHIFLERRILLHV